MTRIDRYGASHLNYDVTARGKRSISINLKKKEGVQESQGKKQVIMNTIWRQRNWTGILFDDKAKSPGDLQPNNLDTCEDIAATVL